MFLVTFVFTLLLLKLVSANKTIDALSESHVIDAVKVFREQNKSFPIIDFYLHMQNNKIEDSSANRYFNVIENAKFHALYGGEMLTYATLSSTKSTACPIDAWLDKFKDDELRDLEERLRLAKKKKQKEIKHHEELLVNLAYRLRNPNNQSLEKSNDQSLEDTGSAGGLLDTLAEIKKTNQSVVEFYLDQQGKSLMSISNELSEAPPSLALLNIRLSFGEKPHDIIGKKINLPVNDTIKEDMHDPTTTVPCAKVLTVCTEKGNTEYNSTMSRSNRFFHQIGNILRKFYVLKISTESSDTMLSPTKNAVISTKVYRKNGIKSKLKNNYNNFFHSLYRIRKKVNENKKTLFSKSLNNTLLKWFLRQLNKEKKSRETPQRRRRDVNLQKSGYFEKIMNIFQKEKGTELKSINESTSKCSMGTGRTLFSDDSVTNISSDIELSKLNCDPFLQPYEFQYFRTKTMNFSVWSTDYPLRTSCVTNYVYQKKDEIDTSITCTERITFTIDKSIDSAQNKTGKPDILLYNAKNLFQQLCNTSGELPLTNMEAFIAGLSTKSGQKWWEALHENNDTSSDLTDSDYSFGEEITTPVIQRELWKYFKKSLTVTVNEYEIENSSKNALIVSCGSESYRKASNISPRCSVRVYSKRANVITSKYASFGQHQMNSLKHDAVKSFHSKYSRYTRALVSRTTVVENQTPNSSITSGNMRALWKYFQNSLLKPSLAPSSTTSSTFMPRTYYQPQSAVFTYKRKPKTTHCTTENEDSVVIITEDPQFNMNGTFDYDHFLAFMRASVSPEFRDFFTETFPTTQVTIKRSVLDMIKNIFRGGKTSGGERRKTESEEDLDHYKKLYNKMKSKGNITQKDVDERKLGNIKVQW